MTSCFPTYVFIYEFYKLPKKIPIMEKIPKKSVKKCFFI